MQVNTKVTYPYDPEYEYVTKLERINLEEEMEHDLQSGVGFLIKEPQHLKKTLKSIDSIYSERYMKTLQDDDSFTNKFSCTCGNLQGIDNQRLICPICHTEVKFIGDNFEIFGWIKLEHGYKIIHPELYKTIESYFGSTNLEAIIEPNIDLNANGTPMTQYDKKIHAKKLKRKYSKHAKADKTYENLGMIEFIERFDEILEYFHQKNKNKKQEYYDDIILNRKNIFTSAIPVFSTGMRPFKVENGIFTFEGTNAIFNIMAKLAGKVNQNNLNIYKMKKYRCSLLWDLQERYNVLYQEIGKILAGKKGNIRLLIGGRCSFTCRSIIVPDLTLRMDEIRLPYHALVELLQQTLINIIARSYNCTYAKAYSIWYKAQISPSDKIKEIITNLIKDQGGLPIIINRNPSIQFGSILAMRCIGFNDTFTMSMPLQVLPGLAADFDGDCLNSMYITNKAFAERAMETFNPRNTMVISPNDGKFNNQVNLYKDILITTNDLINLGRDTYSQEELNQIYSLKAM